MTREKTSYGAADGNSGFTLTELLLVIAIVGIAVGFASFSIIPAVSGLRANQAVNQTVTALRESRMLAMTQDRMVSLQFPATNRIEARIRDTSNHAWVVIGVDAAQRRTDPSVTLGNSYIFSRDASLAAAPGGGGSVGGDIVFNGNAVTPASRLVFTPDGFLTDEGDVDSPINGTIYIGAPNGNVDLARAITIRGATGSTTAWQWRKGAWRKMG